MTAPGDKKITLPKLRRTPNVKLDLAKRQIENDSKYQQALAALGKGPPPPIVLIVRLIEEYQAALDRIDFLEVAYADAHAAIEEIQQFLLNTDFVVREPAPEEEDEADDAPASEDTTDA